MKTSEDFRKEYPEMDHSFRCAVLKTLQDLGQEEVKPVKKKLRFGLVIVLAVMLLGTVAIAASVGQWGLKDFLNIELNLGHRTIVVRKHNPEASQAMRRFEEPLTMTTPYGTISVREHAYDGFAVYLVMDVMPAEGVLLLPDSVHSIHDSISFVPEFSHLTFSAEEFAEYSNRPEIIWFIPSAFIHYSICDAVFSDDGSATFLCQFMMEDQDTIQDSFSFYLDFLPARNLTKENVRHSWEFTIYHAIELTVPLEYTPPLAIASSGPVESKELGGFTASLTLIRTPMTTYCLLQYPDEPLGYEHTKNQLIKLLDETGQELPFGTWNGFHIDDDQILYTAYLDKMPNTVILASKEFSTTPDEIHPFHHLLTFHLTPQPQ